MDDSTIGGWTPGPVPEGPEVPEVSEQLAAPAATPPRPRLGGILRRRAASIAALGGLAVGGIAGGYVVTQAASSPSPSPSATATPGQASPNGSGVPTGPGPQGGGACMHGLQSEDLSLVAGAIGISSSDLQTALQNGQTIAAVAKAHNVDVNKVISAWVASENKEIDDRVASGQITSAQATQMKQQTQQRITDEVNGTHTGGGPGGPGGPGAFGFGGPPPGGAPPSA
jgi:hypothetical protein